MRTHIQAFIICLFYLFCFSLSAEEIFSDKYNFSHLTKDTGLPSNYIRHIIKDSQEYMWIATNNGVARYDGYTITPLTVTSSPVSIKSNYVHKLCEDNYKRLWIASEKGIDVIDPDQHTSLTLNIEQHSFLSDVFHSHSTAIYKSNSGDLWISYKQSLLCLEFDQLGRIASYYTIKEGESNRTIKAVIDVDGTIFAGVNGTVAYIRKEDNHFLSIEPLSELGNKLFEKRAIQCMEIDGDELWIGTNRGLFKYNCKRKEVQAYTSASDASGMLSQLDITDIKKGPSGEIIIATLNGLNQYDKESDSFNVIRKTNKKSVSTLSCNQINCILAEQHQIWVGTENGGVNILSKGRLSTYSWEHDNRYPESLSPNPVNAICEDRDGNLWVGTKEGGLNVKRRGEDTFIHYVKKNDRLNSISDNSITAMLVDQENQLWICTWGKGVNRFDLNNIESPKIKQYHRKSTPQMNGDFAHSACEDSINNGIWFGTTGGLYFFNKKDETFKPVEFNLPSNNFDSMRGLCIDKQHRLWVGSSIGLFIVDLLSFAHNQINFDYTHIDHKLTDYDTHPDKINCIVQDRKGSIWIGTNGNGLYRFIGEKNGSFAFKNYTTINGLPNNTILGIVDDRLGNLWMSTDMGISRLSKGKEVFSNYTKDDGLLTNQFYFNAFLYSELDDLIYFGNTEGLIAIDPKSGKSKSDTIKSKVSISGITISGNVIYPSSGNYISHHIANATDVFLHEKERTFSFYFTTKAYGLNHLIRYAYRLKGYEEKWNEGKVGEHMALYTSVPAGSYNFQVKATDDNGHWSDEVTELKIHIAPYFYKTWWFLLLVITVILSAFYFFYSWKTRNYRIQNEKLEEKVKRRTEKLDKQNKQLLEMSRILANTTEEKITFFTNVTHEFRTPVTLIQGPIEKALQLSKEPAVTEQLQMAKRNSANLLTLVNELLDFRKLEVNKITLRKSSGHYKEFLEQTLMPLKAYARDKQIAISTYYRVDTANIIYDYDHLRKLVVNLVSNAIRFTPQGGEIKIYNATLYPGNAKQLYISVCDNGMGIAKEDVDKVFDYYYQSNNHIKAAKDKNSGIGLYLCKNIVEMHDGTIKAINNKARGASFRVILPQVAGEKEMLAMQANNSEEAVCAVPKDQKERILVVDDNEDMRTYVDTLLRSHYQILQASNGVEALQIINQTPIDLIISDLMMPVMDGLELSQKVKEDIAISHIPFIMLTAIVSEEQRRISYQIGVDMYLCKPFDEKELQLRIQNVFAAQKKYKQKFAADMGFDSLPMREGSKDKKFIDTAISLMKKHYSDSEYEVTAFIADIGCSKTQVNRKFNDLVGQSTGQFMRNYRLNMAHELLKQATKDTDINISEVAYAVGFSDPKYFTRCFKEFFGILPSVLLKSKI